MRNSISTIPVLIVILISFFSCTKPDSELKLKQLSTKATQIDNDFKNIRLEVEILGKEIADLYVKQNAVLPTIKTNKYELAANGVFTKPMNDGGSAVFVSGVTAVNQNIKDIVYFTEPLDSNFKALAKKYPEIVQLYYNDKNSYNRIYPYFDVLSQYEAKMNIPDFNFYYLADAKHNPKRKSLWVNEPYVDPAGRGWMVSAIAPVYYKNEMVGVPGIDVTINTITQRYLQDNIGSMVIIIDNSGSIVTAQEDVINLLSFPPLYDHKYIETIKQDTFRKERYNLALSREANVRTIATEILKNKKQVLETELNGEKATVIAVRIPELNWYLLEIIL
ncbi:MAG: hypothetical protein AUK44_08000 [Porphyromonadaceae bacterium CG2_30_38_12]|nr:MAG: hypothetical protein AUK44_08000 [Porphyromonadaceae bacterium CG2_30_38_12]